MGLGCDSEADGFGVKVIELTDDAGDPARIPSKECHIGNCI